MTTTYQPRSVLVPGPVELWCRDLVSCLQSTFAGVLAHAGHDPLEALASHWEFRYHQGDVRSEEFYYPCAVPGDLAASLMPGFGVSSPWRRPASADDAAAGLAHTALAEVIDELSAGQLVIAAVDNFYLPFRPAFGDVHAAHLLIVTGVDLDAGQVHVSDAMPPAFAGPIPVADFVRAWSSANPADVQDVFFSDAKIDRRFMTLSIGAPFPRLDRGTLRAALAANLAGFRGPAEQAAGVTGGRPPGQAQWVGLTGLDRFIAALLAACADGDSATVADTYPFGWGMQAQASLHAELLRHWGVQTAVPALREAGRLVEATAHGWTGLRMTAAHGRDDPAAWAGDLARHARALRHCYDLALAGLDEAVELL